MVWKLVTKHTETSNPQTTSFKKWMFCETTNFLRKDLVHHPIDSQPFFKWLFRVPGSSCSSSVTRKFQGLNELGDLIPGGFDILAAPASIVGVSHGSSIFLYGNHMESVRIPNHPGFLSCHFHLIQFEHTVVMYKISGLTSFFHWISKHITSLKLT